jgi:iron complex outermembrane receptor protein
MVTPGGNTGNYFFNTKRDNQYVDQLDLRNTVRVLGRTVSFTVGAFLDDNNQRRHSAASGAGTAPAMNYLNPIAHDPANEDIVRSVDATTNTKAAYFESMVRVTEKLVLSGGARQDHIRNNRHTISTGVDAPVNFHAVTGRYALTYTLRPGVNLYVGRSSAIQPGGFINPANPGAGSTGATALVNLTVSQAQFSLQPSRSWEGGIKATTWRNRLEGTLSYFSMRKYNMINVEVIDGITFVERVGKMKSEGIEFQFTAAPIRMFTLQGDFVWNNARYLSFKTVAGGLNVDRTGNWLPRVPAVQWSVTPTVSIGPVSGNLSIKTRAASFSDNANTQRLSPFTVLNSNINIRLARGTQLTLTGRNLTDEVIINRGGIVTGATTARIGLPRNYGMQLTKTF